MEPGTSGPPSDPPLPGSADVSGLGAGVRILLVEDNADISRVLISLLTRTGYRVLGAASIADAVQKVRSEGPFDLMISDLSLPDGSGLELKRRLGEIRAIAISGYSTEIDLQECLDAGYLELLSKPIEFSTLKEVIDRIARGP